MEHGSNAFNGFKRFFDLSLPQPDDPKSWFSDLNKVLKKSAYPIYSKECVCQQMAAYMTSFEGDVKERPKVFQRMLSVIKKFQREFLWFRAIPQLINLNNNELFAQLNNINLFYAGVLDFLEMQQEDEKLRKQVKAIQQKQSFLFAPTLPAGDFFKRERIPKDLHMQVTLYLAYLEKLPKIFPELTKEAREAKEETLETANQVWHEMKNILSLIGEADFKLPSLPAKDIEENLIILLKSYAEEGHLVMPRSAVLRPMGMLAEGLALFLKPSCEAESISKPIFPSLTNKYNQLIQNCNLSLKEKEKLTLFKHSPKYSQPKVSELKAITTLLSLTFAPYFALLAFTFLNPFFFIPAAALAMTGLILAFTRFRGESKALVNILKGQEQNGTETTRALKQALEMSHKDLQIKHMPSQMQEMEFNLSKTGFLGRRKSAPAEAPMEEATLCKRAN